MAKALTPKDERPLPTTSLKEEDCLANTTSTEALHGAEEDDDLDERDPQRKRLLLYLSNAN